MVKVVADREGGPPDHTVVTRPANWGEYKRELLDQALTQADIGTVSVAAEPEAAAVHCASTTRRTRGGGRRGMTSAAARSSVAVLRNTGDGLSWWAIRGIEQLGGVYFDEAVFAWVTGMADAFATLDPDDPATVAAVSRPRRECVEAKETLSWDTDTAIPVALPNQRTEIRITRSEFEDLIRPALGDTVDAMRRALSSADVEPAELRSVLLVGGSASRWWVRCWWRRWAGPRPSTSTPSTRWPWALRSCRASRLDHRPGGRQRGDHAGAAHREPRRAHDHDRVSGDDGQALAGRGRRRAAGAAAAEAPVWPARRAAR